MNWRPKCNNGNNETPRWECRQNTLWHKLKHLFSPKAEETKAKTNLIQSKSFCTAKGITDKTKRQTTEWKNIFADNMTNKG